MLYIKGISNKLAVKRNRDSGNVMMRRAAFLLTLLLTACSPGDLPFQPGDLPPGDAARGAALFDRSIGGAPACDNCHSVNGDFSSGPGLRGYGEQAATRVSGQSGVEYTFYSIMRPAKHVVRGYSNVMYGDYDEKLDKQDVADLIAYLMAL